MSSISCWVAAQNIEDALDAYEPAERRPVECVYCDTDEGTFLIDGQMSCEDCARPRYPDEQVDFCMGKICAAELNERSAVPAKGSHEDDWIDEEAESLIEPTVNNDGRFIVRHPETGEPIADGLGGYGYPLPKKFNRWSDAYVAALHLLGKSVTGG